jgi:hypothetical protein
MDIGGGQDRGRLVEGDPIRRGCHPVQSGAVALPASLAFTAGEAGASADPLSVFGFGSPLEVPSDVDLELPGDAVARRSFFAQPDPL